MMMSEGQEFAQKPRIIQFKGEQGRIQRVDIGNLEAVFANIEAHNKEFSLGTMLAKELIFHVRRQESEDSEASHLFSAEKDKSEALEETLGIIYGGFFTPIGISLDTASDTGVKIFTEGEEIGETKIKFGLQNPNLFLSFLDALDTTDRKELNDTGATELISKIGYDLFLQIYQHYNNFNKDERVPMIAHRLDEIVSRYKKLGIKAQYRETDRTEDLERYAEYSSKGILQEYITANFKGLLEKPEDNQYGFSYNSFANWRNDIGLEHMQKRWESAISVLGQIKKNPKAKGFFEEIKVNLARCIELALKDIDSKDETWDKENGDWVNRKDKREVFENARVNLQLI